jgi:hypothetical protein
VIVRSRLAAVTLIESIPSPARKRDSDQPVLGCSVVAFLALSGKRKAVKYLVPPIMIPSSCSLVLLHMGCSGNPKMLVAPARGRIRQVAVTPIKCPIDSRPCSTTLIRLLVRDPL